MSAGVCGIRGRKNMRGRVSFADEEEREKKGKNQKLLKYGKSLATKLIIVLGYKLTQYIFIGGEF